MHYWGDEWFQKNGDDLYAAINYIEKELRKYHIGICGKEKWGCYRDDFLTFWNGGLYQILFGYRTYINSFVRYPFKWMENLANKFHKFIYFTVDEGLYGKYWKYDIKDPNWLENLTKWKEKRWWKGFKYYIPKTKLYKIILQKQFDAYNRVFQTACKKWPNVTDELISDLTGYELIKPGIWGSVDGEAIHNKYWKKV